MKFNLSNWIRTEIVSEKRVQCYILLDKRDNRSDKCVTYAAELFATTYIVSQFVEGGFYRGNSVS